MAAGPEDIPVKARIKVWTRNALILSVALHLLIVVVSFFVTAIRHDHRPQAQFVSAPLPTQAEETIRKPSLLNINQLQQRTPPPPLQVPSEAAPPTSRVLPTINANPQILTRPLTDTSGKVDPGRITGLVDSVIQVNRSGQHGTPQGIHSLLSARCDANTRTALVREAGGSAETEQAVRRALRWLQRTQNQDGSWGMHTGAMTGFALLAFLGHCETPRSAEFGLTVERAIDYLVALGERHDGSLAGDGGREAYQHAIATYALAEAYALTGVTKIVPVLRRAVTKIIKGQTADGGWMYGYRDEITDVSVTVWQIQALKSAHVANLRVEGLEDCLDRAVRNLLQIQNRDGGFPYHPGGDSDSTLTGAGVLALQLWKYSDSNAVERGIEVIHNRAKDKLNYSQRETKLYGWYYNTLACFLQGGNTWKRWHQKMHGELTRVQQPDGSWPEEGGRLSVQQAKEDATLMRTCLCALILEVYYRYLPSSPQ